jgi:hypothetical protein
MTRPGSRKTFTVQEANATLPLVRAIVADLSNLSREVAERRERLSLLLGGHRLGLNDPYHEELLQIQEELDKDSRRLQEYVEELRGLGVEPKTEGLVDFPTVLDGRKAYLCWKLGEGEVRHWHETDAGFHDRRPLTADSGVGEDLIPTSRGSADG